ncbi:hypothetical protein B4113_2253 [Geobacillus sp. B4113_201601]|nr:hypothetical protein B4113_2253 [Geobacillus sp. B4113_201601]
MREEGGNKVSKLIDIEQERAKFAYDCASFGISIAEEKKAYNDEYYFDENYASYVKKIPALIKTNGLSATFAYVFAKRKKEDKKPNGTVKLPGSKDHPKNAYDLIYEQTRRWLADNPVLSFPELRRKDTELMKLLLSLNSEQYRQVTLEILRLFQWLRRFVEGVKLSGKIPS